jgi:hypothetical protein
MVHLSLPETLARTWDFESLVANRAKKTSFTGPLQLGASQIVNQRPGPVLFSHIPTRLVPLVVKLPFNSSTHRGAQDEKYDFGVPHLFLWLFSFFLVGFPPSPPSD